MNDTAVWVMSISGWVWSALFIGYVLGRFVERGAVEKARQTPPAAAPAARDQ